MKAKPKAKKRVVTKTKRRTVVKKKVTKMKRPSVAPSRKQPTVLKKVAIVRPVMHGKVVHFYDKISVAIVEVEMPFGLGDFVRIRHGDSEFIQPVTSLQVEHLPVARAGTGQVVGMRVTQPVPEGAVVLPM